MSRGSVWGIALGLILAALSGSAHAEALPGGGDVSAGVHLMVLPGDRCEADGDVIGCSGPALFAGFELAGQAQVTPWLSLGLRAAASNEFGAASGSISSDGDSTERSLWFWRISGQARFDPPIWPRGLWLAVEVGTVLTVDSVAVRVDGQDAGGASITKARFLAGAAAGWDFAMTEHWLLGVELRALLLAIDEFQAPPGDTGTIEMGRFPYISLSPHLGYRW